MRPRTLRRIVSCLALGGAAATAHADLIIYEPFRIGSTPASGEYSTGSILPSQNPTVANFSGAWAAPQGSTFSAAVNIRPSATGLTYGTMPTEGGSAESFRSGTGSGGEASTISRPIVNSAATTISASTQVYFSVLVNVPSGRRGGAGPDFENRSNFGVGIDTDGQAGIYANGAFVSKTGSVLAANTTYLLVGRMTPNNAVPGDPELIELLAVNPVDLGVEPGTPVLSSNQNVWGNVSTTDTLDALTLIFTKSTGGSAGFVDEIRIGTSWADVVPVPEPGTLALLLGGTALCAVRRRPRRA